MTDEIVTYNRAETVAKWLRDYAFRVPDADTGPNGQPWVDANVAADQVQILHADAVAIGNNTNLETTTGTRLEEVLEAEGVTGRLPAAGASGGFIIETANGGATLTNGMELRHTSTSVRYQFIGTTGAYADGDVVPIVGIDTGPSTNQDPGTILQWTSPTNGLLPTGTVFEQSDGSGLDGGRDEETDEEAIDRLIAHRANPPASGNAAAYIEAIRQVPNLAIQAAFAYPADGGPGMTSIAFTMRPSTPGASRLPDLAARTLVRTSLEGAFPGDDGIFDLELVAEPLVVVLGVTWRTTTPNWANTTTWPVWIPGDPVVVDNAVSITPLSFRVTTATATSTPQTGQTVAVYNTGTGLFVAKRIATVVVVVADKSWDLTFDASASDTTYAPADGQIVSPWSDSLNALPTPVIDHVDNLGPSELYATFPDPGQRLRRTPQSPEEFPSALTNRLIVPVQALSAIADAELFSPSPPFAAPIGTPRTLAYVFELTDLAAFPQ